MTKIEFSNKVQDHKTIEVWLQGIISRLLDKTHGEIVIKKYDDNILVDETDKTKIRIK